LSYFYCEGSVVSQYLVVATKADRTEYKTYCIPVEPNRRLLLNTFTFTTKVAQGCCHL